MEIRLTMSLENRGGGLKLIMKDCSCSMKDIFITVEGGASWLYQGLVDAFEDQIRSAVEAAIKKKISEGISKIDSSLQNIPKEIRVDDIVSLNVSVVDDPRLGKSSIEFDIDGLFFARNQVLISSFLQNKSRPSISCNGSLKMLGMSFDEEVFTSASVVFFEAGQLHWVVDEVPDRHLLNTAGWRFIIPQLYKKYPNDDMKLNVSVTSAPILRISRKNIVVSILSDIIVNVLDGNKMIPVACIATVVTASGVPEISGNNLAGRLALEDFTLNLKWSTVGAFHMNLIQGVMRVFLNNVFIPHLNSHLRKGFPVPIIHGFTLKNATILSYDSRIVVCTDIISSCSRDLMPM
ncbi:hypothetical protein Taro_034739 [Colocasia esculenta]|uniref:Lipid-binding serum glycoprotein C-terminal domain-containing protein n=1 Tax=Colocasia esculenta TaxID=4460 RepID=A0A843VYI8_COLES|nr:hypothetical protein [Colocasia esculenta]